jgi:two-component system, NarL family, capsular synthesis sensor histidine kinase RcsC
MEHRILVAEDDSANRRLLEIVLQTAGFRVEVVANGSEALKRALESPFDLIISDRAMPGLAGEQLAAELHRMQSGTPVILLSGDLFDKKSPVPKGVRVRLLKPIAPAALLAAVHEVLGLE